MNKFKSKKGFTLAELLIVVAIIAVLVAIAVPLFVGSLNKAQKARDDANVRAVRGAAVVYLLEKGGDTTLWPVDEATGASTVKGWNVTAIITNTGDISKLTVAADTTNATEHDDFKAAGKVVTDTEGFKVTLFIAPTEVSKLPSAVTP